MEWLLLALFASIFTSLTTLSAKIALKNVNSDFATFFRTLIIVVFSFICLLVIKDENIFKNIDLKNFLFLSLSGLFTGLSWLCYFRAMKLGDCNKVVAIDKCSYVLTTILFLIFFFDVTTKNSNPITIIMIIVSSILILSGTIIMIPKKDISSDIKKSYLFYAILSCIFASFVSLFVKFGVTNIDTLVAIFIRTTVVLIFSFIIVVAKKELKEFKNINIKTISIITISGLFTFFSWFFEYLALQDENKSPVVVSAVTKLSIVLTFIFSFAFLKEKLTKKTFIGLLLLLLGIVLIVAFSL